MKEIMCIIRLNKVSQTKEALYEAGFPAVTFIKVFGRGKKSLDQAIAETFIESGKKVPASYDESVSEKGRLIPKRLITLMVSDDKVKTVVDTIIAVNSTGSPGDGKIFVLPVKEAYRVRDRESGTEIL
ncbi:MULTISPECIES: P-II family nitrogen regulator [unclassified Clostridium]|uniref:P-II family nitrogen regulator n=1 Tax=unclassified Clostridium TaxID=2614128 RepID=UPI000297D968|nr:MULTISPECIES: P-II family nitrogen regulator [unclassified Clostridium]EKQ52383.1 MAG: nitrogen regulatory protein PII [Clostridium sp. Maddingley MBC34-26]